MSLKQANRIVLFKKYLFEQFLETTTNPYYGGSFQYGPLKSGNWRPMTNDGLINIMADHVRKHAPRGASMAWDDRLPIAYDRSLHD